MSQVQYGRAIIVLLVMLIAATACGDSAKDGGGGLLGGKGPSAGGTTFDNAKADDIAHAAMLTTAELPGGGWSVESEDRFTTTTFPNVTACDAVSAVDADSAKRLTGRAEREFTRDVLGSELTLDVSVGMDIHDSNEYVSTLLSSYKTVVSGGNFVTCMDAIYREQAGNSTAVSTRKATPIVTGPGGGVAFALDIEIAAAKRSIRLESYTWSIGNAELGVTFAGPREAMTPEAINAVIARLDAAAKDAGTGKRQRPAWAVSGLSQSEIEAQVNKYLIVLNSAASGLVKPEEVLAFYTPECRSQFRVADLTAGLAREQRRNPKMTGVRIDDMDFGQKLKIVRLDSGYSVTLPGEDAIRMQVKGQSISLARFVDQMEFGRSLRKNDFVLRDGKLYDADCTFLKGMTE